MLSLDQWKAFDRVCIPFLNLVMEKMGFDPKMVDWVTMLHEGNSTQFILGDSLSKEIKIKFSIRQGDPYALSLYLIFVESLMRRLRVLLPGLPMGKGKVSASSYVDDQNCVIIKL